MVEGFEREQNTEEDIPVLCNDLKSFTLGELSIKDEQDEIKPLVACKLEIVQVVVSFNIRATSQIYTISKYTVAKSVLLFILIEVRFLLCYRNSTR